MINKSALSQRVFDFIDEFEIQNKTNANNDVFFYGILQIYVTCINSGERSEEISKVEKVFNNYNIKVNDVLEEAKEKIYKSIEVLNIFSTLTYKRFLIGIERFCITNKISTITLEIYLKKLLEEPTEFISYFINKFLVPQADLTETEQKFQDKNEPETELSAPVSSELLSKTRQSKLMQEALMGEVFGQDEAIVSFTTAFFKSEIKNVKKRKPRATFLFTGPSGVGKTYLAELIAEELKLPYARFDMSEYADKEANLEFAGIDKSYKASKMGNVTSFVHENPKSVLIFDEVEKAHYIVQHLFLQILDAGGLRDNYLDEVVSFEECIIIFTSNAGRNLYDESDVNNLSALPKKVIVDAIKTDKKVGSKDEPAFPPALISRFSGGNVVMFNKLGTHDLIKIAEKEFKSGKKLIKDKIGLDIITDTKLPYVILFTEGNNADARTISARAESLFFDEMYELSRLIEQEDGGRKLANINTIKIEIEEPQNDTIKDLFKEIKNGDILLFGDKDKYNKIVDAFPEYNFYFADTVSLGKEILTKNCINIILCDLSCNSKNNRDNVINLEDVNSEGRDFFYYVTENISKPIFALQENDGEVTKEENLSLTSLGSRGLLTFSKKKEFSAQVKFFLDASYRQEKLFELIRSNKVLTYKTLQEISNDGKSATIKLYDFALDIAVDSSEVKDVLGKMQKPNVKFEEIIGAEDAKSELKYFIEYLKNPMAYAKQGVKAPKGVLLYGPPGTGKTMLAKAMAGESDVAFISAEGNQFIVEDGIAKVHTLFAKARKYAPAIVFIDEIDALGKDRKAVSPGVANILTAFLTEMDGFKTHADKPVFVLGATNYGIDNSMYTPLDPAFLRRFDRKILVDLPKKADREKFIRLKAKKHPILQLSDEQISNIANRSTDMSLAELDLVIEYAMRNAIKNKDDSVSDKEFDDAFESYNGGEVKKWDESELEKTARHEAGHALVAWLSGNKPSYLTIVARGNHGGYMRYSEDEKGCYTKDELLNFVRVSLAGRAAELTYYGKDGLTTGASADLINATNVAKSIVCSYGMDEEFGLATLEGDYNYNLPKVRERVNIILAEQLEKAKTIISDNKFIFEKLVAELLKTNRLTGDEIDKILSQND